MTNMLGRATNPVIIILIALCWGLNWPAVRLALHEIPPWTLRVIGMGAGSLFLFSLAALTSRPLRMARADWGVVFLAGFLSITAFNILLSFAQLAAPTSRAVIVTFTMPFWTVLFARIILGERLDQRRRIALAVGGAGLICLGWPLIMAGSFGYGLMLALLAGISWALGTVVLKRFPVTAPPMTVTAWQLLAGALAALCGVALFEPAVLREGLDLTALHAPTWGGLAHHILFSQALAYLLWYALLARMPAGRVSLATLPVPAIGSISSVLLLGERPTPADVLGLILLTLGAAIVMLPARQTAKGQP
ncbi:DMT family transporter [Xinfangfangia sp. D13-10-4-6]|uniref:DMT family transporter n=1 Tax=Pseudogemmobacter hezensis TaxID=2737662 RepID=UPI001556D429|nr:DMT family transporter [Pseudogemmobacter hezensis]NPD17051.1 DMT family transporter [Pseudogemmobacter hezensis]